MGALKLCTYKKAAYPLYLETLSVQIETMEELCYAMESNLFLLDESWMNKELFAWLQDALDAKELAAQVQHLYHRKRDVYACAELIFASSGYYSGAELNHLEQVIERIRGKNQMERRKMRADYFLSKKRYRYAAYGYLELLQPEFMAQMTEELQGHIMHNLGVAYARLFLFPEAARMFSAAYQKSREERSKLCYLYAMNYINDEEQMEEAAPEIHFGTMKEAFSHLTDVSDQEQYYQERKKISDANHAFNWKSREEEIRTRWIREYEEMYS